MIITVQGAAEIQNGIYYQYDSESNPLGQGGMGIVYEGRCFRVDNPNEYVPVAIKKITNTTPDLIERAMREASIQIDHPNLLRMWGFIPNMEPDPYTNTYKTQYYIVMDRLIGVDLYSLIYGVTIDKSGYNVEYAQKLYSLFIDNRFEFVKIVMTSVLNAISELHKAGYIHRDIDPSNVMVTNEEQIKLIDFGISKTFSSLNDNGHKLTKTGAIIGKADYAAPEIVIGDIMHHNVTTDIYALGIMLFQLYSGELPFSGTDPEIMQAQLNEPLPLKNIDNPSIRAVIEKATQKKQSARYQSVEDMKADFENCTNAKKRKQLTDTFAPKTGPEQESKPDDKPGINQSPTSASENAPVTGYVTETDGGEASGVPITSPSGPKVWVWVLISGLGLVIGGLFALLLI